MQLRHMRMRVRHRAARWRGTRADAKKNRRAGGQTEAIERIIGRSVTSYRHFVRGWPHEKPRRDGC